jgi:hypothetical protein
MVYIVTPEIDPCRDILFTQNLAQKPRVPDGILFPSSLSRTDDYFSFSEQVEIIRIFQSTQIVNRAVEINIDV